MKGDVRDEHRLSNMMIIQLLEPAYGHMINKEELVLRNDAEIIAAAALGMPVEFPTLTDDPEECKKLVTDYFRRLYGVGLYNLSVKPRLAREATSLPLIILILMEKEAKPGSAIYSDACEFKNDCIRSRSRRF